MEIGFRTRQGQGLVAAVRIGTDEMQAADQFRRAEAEPAPSIGVPVPFSRTTPRTCTNRFRGISISIRDDALKSRSLIQGARYKDSFGTATEAKKIPFARAGI